MFVTPRIWQSDRRSEFYPAPRSRILYRTPPLPRLSPTPVESRFSRRHGPTWARSAGFTAAPRNGLRIAERLKQTPCPHCKVVGTLIRHGFLYGFDDSNPQRKTVRARRIFCSNRHARPGCGRTFSVWLADKIRRLSLTTGASVAVPPTRRRRQHPRRHPRRRLPSQRPDLAAHLETLRPGPKQDPHGTVGALPAARTAGSNRAPAGAAQVLAHLQAAFPDADCPIAAFQHTLRTFFV